MYSLRQLLLPFFWPKHSKLSMKSNVLALSHIWPWHKNGQRQPKVIKCTTLVELEYLMLHTVFQGHQSISSSEENFLSFFHIWAWQPSWSCDPFHLYKVSFPFAHKLSYELWFQITQLFLRKTSFNFDIRVIFDQGQTMTLTFDTHSTSLTHLVECFKQLWDQRLQ